LLIGACEWADLKALDKLLELGATPLARFCTTTTRTVFSQFFIFVLQVNCGTASSFVADASLYDKVLEKLTAAPGMPPLSSDALSDKDGTGFTPMHHAAAFGNLGKVAFLLSHGADPNALALEGLTPLIVASQRGQRAHIRLACLLLDRGADLHSADVR
ncbi:unnamed protein product, partial [Discosporangium mesarthrocarpum]